MTGLELLPKAKALRPDVPVIMITAYGDAETKRRVLDSGAETLLSKPIDFAALRTEIDTRIKRAPCHPLRSPNCCNAFWSLVMWWTAPAPGIEVP